MTEPSANSAQASAAPEPGSPLVEAVSRWAGKAAETLSTALAVKLAAGKVEVVPSDGDSLQEIFLDSGVWVRADLRCGGSSGLAFVFAAADSSKAAIALQTHKDDVPALDEAALAAFGEFAKAVLSALAPSLEPAPAAAPEFTAAAPVTQAPQDDLRGWKGKVTTFPLAPEGKSPIALKLFLSESACGILSPSAAATVHPPAETAAAPQTVGGINRILTIGVPVVVEIARRRITLKEVVAFKPGTVVEFEKKSDDLLDLTAGTAKIGKGEAVKIGESFGLRVLEVGSVFDRIKSLGKPA